MEGRQDESWGPAVARGQVASAGLLFHAPTRAYRIVNALARMVNTQPEAVFQGHDARTAELTDEIERLEGRASHLVRFLATGGDSPAVRAELRTIETTLEGLRAEWATIEKASALPPPRVHPAWVMTKLEQLDALLRRDPQRAKVEIQRHLDGDLVIVPRPAITSERRAEISGPRKKRQPPEGSGGCLPTGGCGGWI